MALLQIIKHMTKRNRIVYRVCNAKSGRPVKEFPCLVDATKYLTSFLRKLEEWPNPVKQLTVKDLKDAERIASRRESWQSWNFAVSKWRGLLQTSEIAEYLGVSEQWVRKNIPYTEWHHSYKQKGDGGKAFFYDPGDVIQFLAGNPELCKKLQKLSMAAYKFLATQIHGEDWERVFPGLGWLKAVEKYTTRKAGTNG